MKKFCNVMKYFFTIVFAISFIFLCGLTHDEEHWSKMLLIECFIFVASYLLSEFFNNRHPVVKRVYAMICCLYVAYVLKFKRNSKDGRMFVKTFTYRYDHSRIKFHKVVSYAFRAYDMNNLKEG